MDVCFGSWVPNFEDATPTVTVTFGSTGSGTVAAAGLATGACTAASCTLRAGGALTLTASPDPGYRFQAWRGCGAGSEGAVLRLPAVRGGESCQAEFVPIRYAVNVQSATGGSVTASATSVVWGGSVTLQARAAAGFRLAGYAGTHHCVGSNPALTISSITSDVTCTASFVRTYHISFSAASTGVAVAATGGHSAASCTLAGACSVDVGGSMTLVATAASGFHIARFACTERGTGRTLSTPANGDKAELTINAIQQDWSCSAAATAILF